jgi:hypothetical protein
LLKAEEAQAALAELAPKVGAARWTHEEVNTAESVDGILANPRFSRGRRAICVPR